MEITEVREMEVGSFGNPSSLRASTLRDSPRTPLNHRDSPSIPCNSSESLATRTPRGPQQHKRTLSRAVINASHGETSNTRTIIQDSSLAWIVHHPSWDIRGVGGWAPRESCIYLGAAPKTFCALFAIIPSAIEDLGDLTLASELRFGQCFVNAGL